MILFSMSLNKEDDDKAKHTAALLSEFTPGFLPYPVFEQVARLVALPIIEFIPIKSTGDDIQVLLIRRPADDPLWANELHTPGTVIRATDIGVGKHIWRPFERILEDELGGTAVGDPHYVGSIMHKSRRGTEQAQIYWVELIGEPHTGELYSINELPSNFMESQKNFVFKAVENYKARQL